CSPSSAGAMSVVRRWPRRQVSCHPTTPSRRCGSPRRMPFATATRRRSPPLAGHSRSAPPGNTFGSRTRSARSPPTRRSRRWVGRKSTEPAEEAGSALAVSPALGVADDDDVGIEAGQLSGAIGESDFVAPFDLLTLPRALLDRPALQEGRGGVDLRECSYERPPPACG